MGPDLQLQKRALFVCPAQGYGECRKSTSWDSEIGCPTNFLHFRKKVPTTTLTKPSTTTIPALTGAPTTVPVLTAVHIIAQALTSAAKLLTPAAKPLIPTAKPQISAAKSVTPAAKPLIPAVKTAVSFEARAVREPLAKAALEPWTKVDPKRAEAPFEIIAEGALMAGAAAAPAETKGVSEAAVVPTKVGTASEATT